MSHNTMTAARLLVALGLIGEALQSGPQPVTLLRTILVRRGFGSNEISMVFGALRNERVRGLRAVDLQVKSQPYMSLDGVVVKF